MHPQRPHARSARPGRAPRAVLRPPASPGVSASLEAASERISSAAAELDEVASAVVMLREAESRLDASADLLLALDDANAARTAGRTAARTAGTVAPPRSPRPRPGVVGLVAAWSLAAQDWAEARVDEYRRWASLGVPPRSRTVALVVRCVELAEPFTRVTTRRLGGLASSVRAAVRRAGALARRSARSGMGLAATVLARGDVRAVSRGLATVVVASVVAVGVLGLGRPSGIEQAGPPPAPVDPGAHGTPDPVAPGPVAPGPADIVGGGSDDDLGSEPAPERPEDAAPRPPVGPPVVPPPVRETQPVLLRAPAIGVDAPIVVVGLEDDEETMEIPSDVRTVGWYEPFTGAGVIPGEAGTAVIAGHVDSRVQGKGAFWSLRDLRPGDVVDVEHADGTTTRWEVESVVRYPKDEIPIAEIFTFAGPERLALITCGGRFDRSANAYPDNYVVTAVPVAGGSSGPVGGLPSGRGS